MFTFETLDTEAQAAFYANLVNQARYLLADERNELANLSNLSALMNMQLSDINWVGFYLWYEREQTLILGPFQGKPACIRIDLGKGVCGRAAETLQAQVVADVRDFAGHIACDPASRSEVVIPMVAENGRLIGLLDIDSPTPGRFNQGDAAGLEDLVTALLAATDFGDR